MASRPPIDDQRFVSIVNEAFRSSRLELSAPPNPADPADIAAWAGFVAACVSRGVEVGDPRWRHLEIRRDGAGLRFRLDDRTAGPTEEPQEPDFGVGLALLMSLLGGSPKDTES